MKALHKALLISPVLTFAFVEAVEVIASKSNNWIICSNYNTFNEGYAEIVLALIVFLGIYYIFKVIVLEDKG